MAKSEVCLYLAVIVMVVRRSGTARVSANQTRLPVASNVLRLLRAVLLTEQSAATGLLLLQEGEFAEGAAVEPQITRAGILASLRRSDSEAPPDRRSFSRQTSPQLIILNILTVFRTRPSLQTYSRFSLWHETQLMNELLFRRNVCAPKNYK